MLSLWVVDMAPVNVASFLCSESLVAAAAEEWPIQLDTNIVNGSISGLGILLTEGIQDRLQSLLPLISAKLRHVHKLLQLFACSFKIHRQSRFSVTELTQVLQVP